MFRHAMQMLCALAILSAQGCLFTELATDSELEDMRPDPPVVTDMTIAPDPPDPDDMGAPVEDMPPGPPDMAPDPPDMPPPSPCDEMPTRPEDDPRVCGGRVGCDMDENCTARPTGPLLVCVPNDGAGGVCERVECTFGRELDPICEENAGEGTYCHADPDLVPVGGANNDLRGACQAPCRVNADCPSASNGAQLTFCALAEELEAPSYKYVGSSPPAGDSYVGGRCVPRCDAPGQACPIGFPICAGDGRCQRRGQSEYRKCSGNNMCPSAQACIEGICLRPCGPADTCGGQEYCNMELNRCLPKCTDDKMCPPELELTCTSSSQCVFSR